MKYAIIEDEEFARDNLRRIIESLRPDYECVFTSESVSDCVRYFSEDNDVSLIFMDIELDDGNCFDIFNKIDLDVPVIFTTAYDEYALKAFKVNSVDYLLKPILKEEVAKAIEKYELHLPVEPDYSSLVAAITPRSSGRVLITTRMGYYFVKTEDVAWIEAADKYVSLVLKDGSSRVTDFASLREVSELFDPRLFYPVSRSVVASVDCITQISRYFKGRLHIELVAGATRRTEVITAARRKEFLEWLGHSGKK
ncbi:MAG: response regulator transcription factor [Bacteroides sp.]|nr:response regulator transcription factor [Bacteroides sp.]